MIYLLLRAEAISATTHFVKYMCMNLGIQSDLCNSRFNSLLMIIAIFACVYGIECSLRNCGRNRTKEHAIFQTRRWGMSREVEPRAEHAAPEDVPPHPHPCSCRHVPAGRPQEQRTFVCFPPPPPILASPCRTPNVRITPTRVDRYGRSLRIGFVCRAL